jgi:hypothetical protein
VSFRSGSSLNTSPIIGSFSFTAPDGGTRIRFRIEQNASSTATYIINSFTNDTPSRPEQPVGFEQLCTLKVPPQLSEYPYKAPPYYVSITATDSLAELTSHFLQQSDGKQYYGTVSLIKLLAFCLSKLQLNLPIRVACNLFAEGMSTDDNRDPFEQAYVDYEVFYIAEEKPSIDFVLRSILEPFRCSLKQWENRWNVVRVDEQVSSYKYRDFDKDGNYISNGTFDPIIEVDHPRNNGDVLLVRGDQYMERRPGYGVIAVKYLLGLKPNIIQGGDFRLKYEYDPSIGFYVYKVDTSTMTIVNGGYPMRINTQALEGNNIALVLESTIEDALDSFTGGMAYIQTSPYNVKMGTKNQLKIQLRYKIPTPKIKLSGVTYNNIPVKYVKVRMLITYGGLYLQSDGSWSSDLNYISFIETTYDEYVTREVIGNQPDSGTPADGMDFSLRLYHAFCYYSDFDDFGDLENLPTYDSVDSEDILPDGHLTEVRDDSFGVQRIRYYRLEENTDTPSYPDIIRPDDYEGTDNPRQWVMYGVATVGDIDEFTAFYFAVDFIRVKFLANGQDPFDTIVRSTVGEPVNRQVLEKTLILGSYSSLITTETVNTSGEIFVDLGLPLEYYQVTNFVDSNVLSADLVYAGWLRDENGEGYEYWYRQGVSERDKLHGIFLKITVGQYKKSWRLMRGSFLSNNRYFGPLNVAKFVNEDNRIYMPISLTLSDRRSEFNAEFMELRDLYTDGGSDGSTEAPYSSAFSIGFGSSGFN